MLELICPNYLNERRDTIPNTNIIIRSLNLKESDVEKLECIFKNDTLMYYITLKYKDHFCPYCNSTHVHIKEHKSKTIKHPTLINYDGIIKYRARRIVCKDCGKTFYEHNPFSIGRHRISNLLKINILKDLHNVHCTYTDVANRYNISNTEVVKIFDSCVHVPRIQLPTILCMDEVHLPLISYKSSYVFLMMNFETNDLIELLPSRKKADLTRYFSKISEVERLNVRYVCIDMWPTYRDISKKHLKNAIICVDCFHVIKNLVKMFSQIRIRVTKSFDKDSIEYYLLKNWNWLLSKKDMDLDNIGKYNKKLKRVINYRQLVEEILKTHPDLKTGYDLLNIYYNFNDCATYENATEWFEAIQIAFIEADISEYAEFVTLLRNWKEEIINSFIRVNGKRLSNGPMESLNGRFDKLESVANGFKNYDRLRLRALYCLNRTVEYSLSDTYSTNKIPSERRGTYNKNR